MERQSSEKDDVKGGENKKVKREDGQPESGLPMILKTENVDEEGIIRLDDDELSSLIT